MSRPRRPLVVLLALLPQLLLALCAPALVVCQEGDGAEVLELSVAGCCAVDLHASDEAELQLDEAEGCGGCEDAILAISLQRDEAQALDLPRWGSAAAGASWTRAVCSLPLRARTPSLEPTGTLTALRTVNLRC